MRNDLPSIAIVGGGASGTLLAIQLLRTASTPLSITIFEPRAHLGRGIAYSTRSELHLLNVPAGNMSAFPDEPGNFLEWLRKSQSSHTESYSFVPRRLYSQYLETLLQQALEQYGARIVLRHRREEVTHLGETAHGLQVFSNGGACLDADVVVMAVGNGPAANPLPASSDVPLRSAWDPDVLADLPKEKGVLLVGSGLTAIDTCLSLFGDDHQGPVYMISRRGLLPRPHLDAPAVTSAPALTLSEPWQTRTLLRLLRHTIAQEEAGGRNRYSVVDALRPRTDEIWQGLSLADQRRFVRHLRPYWEVVRHRMAPQVAQMIGAMQSSGQLRVIRGRIREASTDAAGDLRVNVGSYSSHDMSIGGLARIINCTGPTSDPRSSGNALLRRIVSDGLGRPHGTYLGLETNERGALVRADGTVISNLLALGPARKGTLWESTAMPEIRRQAQDLAHDIGRLLQEPR